MFDFLKNNPLVEGASVARLRPRSAAVHFIIFFLVMTVTEMVASLPASAYSTFRVLMLVDVSHFVEGNVLDTEGLTAAMTAATEAIMKEDFYIVISLLSMAIVGVLVIVFCRFIERRPVASMGLSLNRRVPLQYGIGLVSGLLMFGLVFLLLLATRSVNVTGGGFTVGMLVLYLFGFLVQGAAEEILVRGYFMISLTSCVRPGAAVLCSALLFALMHVGNVGVSLFAVLNIFLFGIFLGLLVFRTGNLFLACALHGIWNFAEGNLFGTPVSGIVTGHSLLSTAFAEGREVTTGGAFGPEGGAAVTLVLFLAIAVLLLLSGKRESTSPQN